MFADADLSPHPEILQRNDVSYRALELQGILKIYTRRYLIDHIYSCRALMGSEIRGASRGCVASDHLNPSY
jgi:hypothetical protein